MGKKEPKKKDKENKDTKKKKNEKDVPLVIVNDANKEKAFEDGDESDETLDEKPVKKQGSKQDQLCSASYKGNIEEVEKLLDKGVDINYRDEYGKSPLHHATSGKQHNIVELLLARGADVTLQDQRGDTPLHAAVRAGDESSVKCLLNQERCDVSAEGRGLCSPLHIACGMDRISICKVLVEHNASIDCKDEDQMTPLGHAVEKGARSTAAYMFEIDHVSFPRVSFLCPTVVHEEIYEYGCTLNKVSYSLEKREMGKRYNATEKVSVYRFILGYISCFTAKSKLGSAESLLYDADSEGSTLLHMAVDSGVTEIVDLCLNNGARVREPKRTDKTTAFHLACSQGPVEMVRMLTRQDPAICRICLIDKGGMSGLHRAATNNQRDVVEYLLDQGASVDLPDKSLRTPLFMAATSGATETVELLISRGANITAKNLGMKSILHGAVGHDNTIDAILKSPAASYLISEKDKNGFAPIHEAAMGGHLQNIHLFMTKNKAAAGITSDSMDTPLHVACKYGWLEIVSDLLVGRNVRMINLQNNQGKTPLHFAAGEGHEKVVELLVGKGATV